jgi:hypothetical protein
VICSRRTMASARYDSKLERGSEWHRTFILRDKATKEVVDLSGFWANFVVTLPSGPYDGANEMFPSQGRIHVFVLDEESEAWPLTRLPYTLEIENMDGNVHRLLHGMLDVNP